MLRLEKRSEVFFKQKKNITFLLAGDACLAWRARSCPALPLALEEEQEVRVICLFGLAH